MAQARTAVNVLTSLRASTFLGQGTVTAQAVPGATGGGAQTILDFDGPLTRLTVGGFWGG